MTTLFAESDLDRLVREVYSLLSEVGIGVDHDQVADMMRAAGCRRSSGNRLCIPAELLDEVVASQRRRQRQQQPSTTASHQGQEPITDATEYCAFTPGPTAYFDYEQRRAVAVDTEILTRMIKFADATPEIARVHSWFRQDAPPEVEPIESIVIGLKLSRKMVGLDALIPAQVKYLVEISEIVTGKAGDFTYLAGSQCMTPPLILGYRAAEEMLQRKRHGVQHYFVATMPMMGVSTPVTVAGAVVIGAAEVIGGMVAAYVIDPEATLTGAAGALVMDMATGSCTIASPEDALFDAGVVELFEQRLGGHVGTDLQYAPCSPVPGLQAVYENFLMAFATAGLLGERVGQVGKGLLSNGGVGSPVQAMLDIEAAKSLTYLDAPIPVTDQTLARDEIIEHVRNGRNWLISEHTLTHFRELWSPRVFLRQASDLLGSTEEAILERCNEAWQHNLRHYEPPDWPEDTLRALDEVVRRARAELLA